MKPVFNSRPVATTRALAAALRLDEKVLLDFSKNANNKYSDFPTEKSDGTMRNISAPHHDLKIIQRRVNNALFDNVKYPDYLYGGVPGKDYVKNATQHSGAAFLIALDIKNFYPSISRQKVLKIFKHFFNFPLPVASVLADLSTRDGSVPQGAPTSSHVANLVFHQVEHILVLELSRKSLTYTRLLDDITISGKKIINEAEIQKIIKRVADVLKSCGFTLRGSKTKTTTISNPKQLMEVTGLWLNRGKPRVKRGERRSVRAEVHECLKLGNVSRFHKDYHEMYDVVAGKVARLFQLGHREAKIYRSELQALQPHYDAFDIKKTRILIKIIKKTAAKDRDKASHIENFHKLVHRVNIVSRTDAVLAKAFRAELNIVAPTKRMTEASFG